MYTIDTLAITGQWVNVDPLTGQYVTFPTLQAARIAATDAEYITGAPCRAREV